MEEQEVGDTPYFFSFILSLFLTTSNFFFVSEKQKMRDQLTELSVVLFSLQQEMAASKARMDQKEKQIENFEKEQYEETKSCHEKVLVVREILDRTISKLENDFQMYKMKAEQTKTSFEEDKADLLKRIETQVNEEYTSDMIL